MRTQVLTPRYVKAVPSSMDEGILYISSYGSAIHKCCCGCGNEVVTPLGPAQWHITKQGDTVTLRPSVGSWNLPCQSHYHITNNRIEWLPKFSPAQIAANQRSDNAAKHAHYDAKRRVGLWTKLWNWLRKLLGI